MSNVNTIITLSGPSGTGKDTVVSYLLQKLDSIGLNISATTRKPREREIDGVNYYYFSTDEFQQKITEQAFLEYEEVYEGLYYGTLLSELTRLRNLSKIPLLVIDVAGARALKERYGDKQLAIFLAPPSIEELEARLRNRNTESESKIHQRLQTAKNEMNQEEYFDVTVINTIVKDTVMELCTIIKAFESKSVSLI